MAAFYRKTIVCTFLFFSSTATYSIQNFGGGYYPNSSLAFHEPIPDYKVACNPSLVVAFF